VSGEPAVSVALFRYSALPNEGWDRAKWDEGHWDGGISADGNWTDITCDVRGIEIKRGKQNAKVDGGVETGTLDFDIDNRDGQWSKFIDNSLLHDGSSFVPALTSGVGIRVTSKDLTTNAVTWHFFGQIETWRQDWTEVDNIVHVTCVDGWKNFVQQSGAPWTPGPQGQGVNQRMVSLLGRTGWDFAQPVYVHPGSIVCIGSVLVGNYETGLVLSTSSVSEEMLKTALSDGGKCFLDADGSFVYLNRNWNAPGTPTAAINPYISGQPARPAQVLVAGAMPLFGDWCHTPPGANELPYSDLVWEYDGNNVIGTIVVAHPDAPQTRDPAGTALPPAWGLAGSTRTSPQGRPVVTMGDLRFYYPAEADALANYYVSQYSDSYIAVRTLEVHPQLDARLWDVAPRLRIGDHFRVLRREPQNTLDLEVVLEGVHLTITPEPWRVSGGNHFGKWVYEYATSEANTIIYDSPAMLRTDRRLSDEEMAPA
jgi:hypothetical protein